MTRKGGSASILFFRLYSFLRQGEGAGVSPPIPFFTSSFFSIFVSSLSPPFVSKRKANVGKIRRGAKRVGRGHGGNPAISYIYNTLSAWGGGGIYGEKETRRRKTKEGAIFPRDARK